MGFSLSLNKINKRKLFFILLFITFAIVLPVFAKEAGTDGGTIDATSGDDSSLWEFAMKIFNDYYNGLAKVVYPLSVVMAASMAIRVMFSNDPPEIMHTEHSLMGLAVALILFAVLPTAFTWLVELTGINTGVTYSEINASDATNAVEIIGRMLC